MAVTSLELAARETIDEAVAGLGDAGYVEWLSKTYRKATEASASDLGREPRSWFDEDRGRILFEAIAYMSALLLEHELKDYLTRRKLLFGREPDRARMEAFRISFLRYLPEKLRSLGLSKVEVPTEGTISAHEVTVVERLREYSRPADGKGAFEHFGACMGRALDPNLVVVTNIVALESIPMLVKVVRGVLEKKFGPPVQW
ncbi:MAG TPA: hypothetical protein VN972_03445 [Methylomirabilota bacterium]|nr:hypothetical protein [Methylomirabilota bacterium]